MTMFYAMGWIAVIGLTVLVSFISFYWAMKSGQFADQNRARFLPLIDLPPSTGRPRPARRVFELYVLIVSAVLVCSAMILAIMLGTGII